MYAYLKELSNFALILAIVLVSKYFIGFEYTTLILLSVIWHNVGYHRKNSDD